MARGRMLNQTVCASLKFQHLPDDTCRLLATWIIPHLDLNGVFYADPAMVKSAVFPRRADITVEDVGRYLDAIEEIGLIVRFQANGDDWQWWPGFADNQVGLRRDRESSNYPPPPTEDAGPLPEPSRQEDGLDPAEEKLREGKTSRKQGKGREQAPPAHPAIVRYFETTGRKVPSSKWADEIEQRIGRDPPSVARWEAVIDGWVGVGWNPRNVKGMLDFYQRDEIPGKDHDNGRARQGHDGEGATELSPESKAIAAALAGDEPTGGGGGSGS